MTAQSASAANRPLAFSLHVLPAVAYVAALFYGGLIRMGELPELGFVPTDKLLHAAAFGGLALLLARAVHFSSARGSLRKCLWLGALGSSVLGALLEVCQHFVPYRSSDPLDWLADTVGAVLAVCAALALLRLVQRVEG
ncbi:MAG: VanZ family protein [Polyangiaceae bacterium]